MQVLYVNNSYVDEEIILRKHGVKTARIEYPSIGTNTIDYDTIIRGPKMNKQQYIKLLKDLEIDNILVTPEQYGIAADAILYSQCFGKYSPKVLSFDIDEPKENIKKKLKGVKLPLFVRSNVESAAKYVGVEACILRDLDKLEDVLKPIYDHIRNAETIIMKEVVPLKKINNKTVEYRAIVINDTLVCFDYDSSCGLPDPKELEWKPIIDAASINGMHGAYFLDLGIDTSNRLFVVECKNLFNGTIKNVDSFAEGLQSIC